MFGQITQSLAVTGLPGLMNSAISNAKSFAELTRSYGIGLAQSTNSYCILSESVSVNSTLHPAFILEASARGVFI
jgi:hypothetical protein